MDCIHPQEQQLKVKYFPKYNIIIIITSSGTYMQAADLVDVNGLRKIIISLTSQGSEKLINSKFII